MQTQQHRDIALGEAINKAAELLPEGYLIRISVEHGAGWAYLEFPDGTEDHAKHTDLGLTESIDYFINLARGGA
jgi:hypothetical protein